MAQAGSEESLVAVSYEDGVEISVYIKNWKFLGHGRSSDSLFHEGLRGVTRSRACIFPFNENVAQNKINENETVTRNVQAQRKLISLTDNRTAG